MNSTDAAPMPRIFKVGSCPSLSGLSTLSYELGCDERSNILIRLSGNSGGGYFNKDWVPYALIDLHLLGDPPLTHSVLRPCFQGKSINSPGFMLAVMKGLGLIAPSEDNPRTYVRTDAAAFLAEVNALMASNVDLANEPAKKTRGKAKAMEPAESPSEI